MSDRSPQALLSDPSAVAEVLSMSDHYASILVTRNGNERSIFQLTSAHSIKIASRKRLASTQEGNSKSPKGMKRQRKEDSARIIRFLSQYKFALKSESGQEYRYFDVTPKAGSAGVTSGALDNVHSPVGLGGAISSPDSFIGSMQSTVISPASDRQVSRATPATMRLVHETPKMYFEVTKPYILSVVESGSTGWVKNVMNKEKEAERNLFDANEYLLNIDTKWRSHPDPKTVPREQWHDHPSVSDLYCLAITKDPALMSMRDFGVQHLPMLRSMLRDCPKVIEEVYGVSPDQIRVFVHYQPQFYHAHIHFTRLHNEAGATVERGHLVSDIVQNLEMDPDYYNKRTISFKLKVTDKLYGMLSASSSKTG